MSSADWYDTRWGRWFFWGILAATIVGVVASVTVTEMQVPVVIYLFGFLGATVYAFTSFAKRFDEDDRYNLKILSRTVAVLPLATGVYLLAFAFPGVSGDMNALNVTATERATSTDRAVAGLVFLAGIYVSATLKALGGLAERLLGLPASEEDERTAEDGEPENGESENGEPENGEPAESTAGSEDKEE